MLVVLYEGPPDDPLQQTMRVVRAESVEAARAAHSGAFCVAKYEKPCVQREVNLRALRSQQPVWSC